MLQNKIVLVLGAGASKELGFPLGSELKEQLSTALDIRFRHGFEQFSGDRVIVEALNQIARERDPNRTDINPFLAQGRAIGSAMPTASSIDSILHTHNRNADLVLMGKLAIARCILSAEGQSLLHERESGQGPDLKRIENTWYAEFFKLLSDDVTDPQNIFKNVAIVSFNYDRSLEIFLVHALMKRFLISKSRAEEILETLAIYHPYGVTGPLPWKSDGIPYGGRDHRSDLFTIVKGLRTFTEGVEEGYVARIRDELTLAAAVLFVGFGFGSINMELLRVAETIPKKTVFATAFDLDPGEIPELRSLIDNTLGNPSNSDIRIYPGCSGAKLFRVCRISFASLIKRA